MNTFWHDMALAPVAGGGWLLFVVAFGLFGRYVLGTMPWRIFSRR